MLIVAWYFYSRDYSSYFVERKGHLIAVDRQDVSGDSLFGKSWVTLKNDRDLTAECGVLTPRVGGRRFPAIIVLGGKATGRHAIDYAIDVRNVILVAPDYPYSPRESYTITQFIADVPEIRAALIDMVPTVLLILDYLWRREDVDTTRVALLGYSFGAPLVPCIAAHDRRCAVAAMVYGGGDLRSLIVHNVRRYEGELVSQGVGLLGALLLRPLEPLRYIRDVAPTTVVMINGSEDEQVPRANAELLYERAREPKSITWLESHHVRPDNVELTRRIISTLQLELRKYGVIDDSR